MPAKPTTPVQTVSIPPTPGVTATHQGEIVTVKTQGHHDILSGLKHLLAHIPHLIERLEGKTPPPPAH